jgi:kynurenine 3-monooxygenase
MDLAEKNGVRIHFSKECINIDFNKTMLNFEKSESLNFDFIFGADGAGSVVRKQMQSKFNLNNTEKFIDCGYKELTIPADSRGKHIIQNDALHIWPRGSYMVIALPNLDGTFTCTLFFPMEGKNSFSLLKNQVDVIDFFSANFSDLTKLIPDLSEQYFRNPVASLGLIRCDSWLKDNVALIGDSCHATVPFYGQGMNAGFEDCFLLNRMLKDVDSFTSFLDKLNSFFKTRKIDTDAMQDLSLHNFIVMRDKTADDNFLLQKKIESRFSEKYPDKWIPLYSLVTFSQTKYSDALKIGHKQEVIMKRIMEIPNIQSMWNSSEVENKILSYL